MPKSLIIAAVFGCAFSASVAMADQREPTAVKVSVSAAELRDGRAVDRVYARLQRGAREACDSNSLFDRQAREEDRVCAARALDVTVARVAQPLLTARHQSSSEPLFARGY